MSATEQQEQSTIERLFQEEQTALRGLLFKYLRDEADVEDVLQDSFVNFLKSSRNGTEIRHAKGFLYTVARNLALDLLRGRSRKDRMFQRDGIGSLESDGPVSAIDQAESPVDVERAVQLEQTMYIIVEVVSGLPPKCSLSYFLIKFEGKSYAEVSSELGMSISSIEKYVQMANTLVREQAANHDLAMAA